MSKKENNLLTNKNILICIDDELNKFYSLYINEIDNIKENFCGIVLSDIENFNVQNNTIIYICGDIEKNYNTIKKNNVLFLNKNNVLFLVIKNISYNYENNLNNYNIINIEQIPLNIHNVGLYFKHFFDLDINYFNLISNEHQFQELTESNKVSNAFRTGIYLTKVEENKNENEIKFRLLRCSSNLNGPTDNFRKTDNEIIELVNNISKYFFENVIEFNHVLAQIYENKIIKKDNKKLEKKAKIKEHSDKTKDMPRNALMAFCTFYKNCFNNYDKSQLTLLRFKLKNKDLNLNLKNTFDIILYPNSLFIISLLTNRLYTHEIVPSILPIDKIPIRLGYVIRCSKTEAVFKNNKTYINIDDKYIKLCESDEEDVKKLKQSYFIENTSDELMNYENFNFSLNSGDYLKPIL